ncbi:hypothetical protein N8I77_001221 [Diaporthe amygdali]|uniref:Uncharacterized protein n=1 Tax=Phomopsis amygdali TaxID=1214568 RepID=A0AAD9W983_PHOAM|nr:hypothetical protein N8I77_001221 [Diaporthe amygdali]
MPSGQKESLQPYNHNIPTSATVICPGPSASPPHQAHYFTAPSPPSSPRGGPTPSSTTRSLPTSSYQLLAWAGGSQAFDALHHPRLTMAIQSNCAHSFQVIKSDSTLIVWHCNLCHSGPFYIIFECRYCKLHTSDQREA